MGIRRCTIGLLAGLAAAPLGAGCQEGPSIEGELERLLQDQGIPGAAFAVVRDGGLVYSAQIGMADLAAGIPVDAKTRFPIGSITKQFTATALMILAEEGRLRIQDRLERWIPEIPPGFAGVTLYQLLTHTSGVPRDFKAGHSLLGRDLFAALAEAPPDFPPASGWNYSNTGFILLGEVVSRASGQSLGSFLQERVFGPLAMSHTTYFEPDTEMSGLAVGYGGEPDAPTPFSFLPARFGAGSIISTAEDLARWDAGLTAEVIISKEAQERMWMPVEIDGEPFRFTDSMGYTSTVGFGWFATEEDGKRLIRHGGSVDGFVGTVERYVDEDTALIILTNYETARMAPLAQALRRHFR